MRQGIHDQNRSNLVTVGPVNNALRPALYNRLLEVFNHNVTVANEGEKMDASYIVVKGKAELSINSPGEYYRVNCPYCGDTRKRLWINHQWGLRDEKGKLNLFLSVCYNENCMSEANRPWELYRTVFTDFTHEAGDAVLQHYKANSPEATPEWPGRQLRLSELPTNHPVRLYLIERGFDPDVLERDFDVRYCVEASDTYRVAQSRIIIPITMGGELKGWQARYVGDVPNKGCPKYYSMPGMKKTRLLYNIDQARQHPFVVLCEGPSDVWAFGPEAVALFGKTISDYQLGLIVGHTSWETVYVCLDGDAEAEGQSIFDQLTNKVDKALVKLPRMADPGSTPTATLRNKVFATPLVIAGE